MLGSMARKLFGSANDRAVKKMQPLVVRIGALESEFEAFDDEALRRKAVELRCRREKGEGLDDLLCESFALVREASKRTTGMRHHDVQLIGGVALHRGQIAEMKTGEGKTLVATLASFLNALDGKGVHIVTVNDFLARRDADWMGQIHRFLGLSVGCVVHGMSDVEKVAAYRADITYGQNNEFGFDYLRDNMKLSLASYFQRDLHYAIVDEVDSILIDEARTPLIISGPVSDDPSRFSRIDRIIPQINHEENYEVDEKARSVSLNEQGIAAVEQALGIDNLYAPEHMEVLHIVQNALRAHVIYKKDVDYVVKDGQVVIVDEFTGRLMEGRRWSDGLHQAVEAKEQVQVQNESQTYASITFQNYFRMYEKLAGMTGTADTEAPEFAKIYNLDVMVVPTDKPMIRRDYEDVVFGTRKEKWEAVCDEIVECHERGQPVLVGTIAIETSELLSRRLKNRGVRHNVLNAKHHGREAEIIAQAGRLGSVTISTNMAGRGTDIVLGGNAEMMLKARGLDPQAEEHTAELEALEAQCKKEREDVLAAGGLFVLGTERHESRRIDNQLRGRSGRQGDPGASRFYLSLEDDLLRIFGGERLQNAMQRLGMKEGEAIEAGMLSRAIERAQTKVEARNFDVRKHLLEYDDVMNHQRKAIYEWRRDILSSESFRGQFDELSGELIEEAVATYVPEREESDVEGLERTVRMQFGIDPAPDDPLFALDNGKLDPRKTRERLAELVSAQLDAQEQMFADLAKQYPDQRTPTFDELGRHFLLEHLDQTWKDHLLAMDHLKEGVGLQGYGGKDPKREYQRIGYELFEQVISNIRERAVSGILHVRVKMPSEEELRARQAAEEERRRKLERLLQEQHANASATGSAQPAATRTSEAGTVQRQQPKVGRNEPCPCGSGKKYKQCHGEA